MTDADRASLLSAFRDVGVENVPIETVDLSGSTLNDASLFPVLAHACRTKWMGSPRTPIVLADAASMDWFARLVLAPDKYPTAETDGTWFTPFGTIVLRISDAMPAPFFALGDPKHPGTVFVVTNYTAS